MAAFVSVFMDDEGGVDATSSVPDEDIADMAMYLRKLADALEDDERDEEAPDCVH